MHYFLEKLHRKRGLREYTISLSLVAKTRAKEMAFYRRVSKILETHLTKCHVYHGVVNNQPIIEDSCQDVCFSMSRFTEEETVWHKLKSHAELLPLPSTNAIFYRVRWHDNGSRNLEDAELLAQNEDQVRAWVDTHTPKSRRLYHGADSLQITTVRTVETLPCVLARSDA